MVQLDVAGDAVVTSGSYYVANETPMVMMNCSLLADPQPTVAWFLNGMVINTSSHPEKYLVQSVYEDVPPIGRYVETLFIQNLVLSDDGNYTCQAQNIHSDLQQPTEATQSLRVLCKSTLARDPWASVYNILSYTYLHNNMLAHGTATN